MAAGENGTSVGDQLLFPERTEGYSCKEQRRDSSGENEFKSIVVGDSWALAFLYADTSSPWADRNRSQKGWCVTRNPCQRTTLYRKTIAQYLEAHLYPHHPSDPFHSDSQDPDYWVTPRHLAGDDGALAERIGETLEGLGWRMWPTSRNTLLYVSPDGLCGAEWILAAYPFELGGLPVAWQLSARPHAASVMTEWNAYFTTGVPYEALADLLVALDTREAPDTGFEGPETVLNALGARGWIRDVDRPRTTAIGPRVLLQRLPGDCCRRSSRTPIRVLAWWAGRRGRNPFSVSPICGARASAPASPMTWSQYSHHRSPPGPGTPPDRARRGHEGELTVVRRS